MEIIFCMVVGAVIGGGAVASYFILFRPDKAEKLHEKVKEKLD